MKKHEIEKLINRGKIQICLGQITTLSKTNIMKIIAKVIVETIKRATLADPSCYEATDWDGMEKDWEEYLGRVAMQADQANRHFAPEFPQSAEEADAHSCYDNSEYGNDGNEYCSVCGRMTKSAEARELDAERYNYDRQAGDFETF